MTDLLALFKERGAVLDGHFLLSSGLHSPRYVQCARVLMDPALATRLGADLARGLQSVLEGSRPDAVVARALGCRGLFTERHDGVMTLRRGFSLEPDERVVVVEDAITTGKSTREVIDAVHVRGAGVIAVGSLVDRSVGAVDFGVPRRSLLRIEAPTWDAAACPLCAAGSRPEKPGSRR